MAGAIHKAPYHLSAARSGVWRIAGVLAMEPEILVLDEPTTFLDPPGQRDLARLLRGLPQAKLLVTHDVEFAQRSGHSRGVLRARPRGRRGHAWSEIIRRFDW